MPFSRVLIVFACAMSVVAVPVAQESTQDDPMERLRDYLQEFSVVIDTSPSGEQRELYSTRLMDHTSPDRFILVYERTRYGGTDESEITSHQIINYTFRFSELDSASLVLRKWSGPLSNRSYWMVGLNVEEEVGFIPYSNLVEERLPDGTIDTTSSRGKSRTLALGYFPSEEEAKGLAERVRPLLRQPVADV